MIIKFNKEDFKAFYKKSEVVENYDKKRLSTVKKRVVRQLEQLTAIKYIKSGDEILEIGVGTGYITSALLKYGNVIGIDSSSLMLKQARKNLKNKNNKLSLINESIFTFNLNKKIDYIVSYRVFMHFDTNNINKALKNIKKHLKDDSLFVFDLPSKSYLKKIIQTLKIKFFKGEEVHNYSYSKNEVYSIIKNNNLEVVDILAIDHAVIFLPIYFLFNYSKKFICLENMIYKLESKLLYFHHLNTRWIIVVKKNEK